MNAQDWDMVASRRADPRGPRFRPLSYEEQTILLEQAIQGVGQHPEAIVAYELEEETNNPLEDIEVTEAHQGSSVQIRVFLNMKQLKKVAHFYTSSINY
jgi:hypothetical protein